jgi:poly(rC)-binding protein 2/3/4
MDPVRDSSWEPVRDPLRDAFRDPLREPVRDPFRETVRDPFREPVRDPFREPVRDLFREPVRDPLREPARDSAPYIMQPTPGNSHNLSRQTVITQNMDHLGLSHSLDRPPSPRLWASQVFSSYLLDINICLPPCWIIIFVYFVLLGLVTDNT